ncbi:MAG: phenylacetate--CoA ligase family protein [Bacteroidetes bacterium]|nr:phenylacetate--CoA ligase family protein [Bacteroidota bacterium]
MSFFEKTLELKGFPIGQAKQKLAEIQSIASTDLKKFQENARWEIVRFHLENNPLYSGWINGKLPKKWTDLPVMTKSDLQQPIKNRLSKGFQLKDVYLNKTSGSSGNPFSFAKDKFSHALTWAIILDRFQKIGIKQSIDLQARFYGIPLDTFQHFKERLKDFAARRYRFPIFNLDEEVLSRYVAYFKKRKFVYLNGYTSSIVLFAKYLQSKEIVLKNICPSLKCCVVTSEMLFAEDRKLLEHQLGVKVVNEYGASELDLIAFETQPGFWEINTDSLFVEILDNDNKPVQNGESGKIVITSLYNKAHPFIRYEIGDLGIMDPNSLPEKPLLKKLIGRTNDMAILPGGKKVPGLTFYYVTKSIMADDGLLKEFTVTQTALDIFRIDYVRNHPLLPQEERKVQAAIHLYVGETVQVIFKHREKLVRTQAGKLKQFVSEI